MVSRRHSFWTSDKEIRFFPRRTMETKNWITYVPFRCSRPFLSQPYAQRGGQRLVAVHCCILRAGTVRSCVASRRAAPVELRRGLWANGSGKDTAAPFTIHELLFHLL